MRKRFYSEFLTAAAAMASGYISGWIVIFLDRARPRADNAGFLYDYQTLIGAFMAMCAAATAMAVPVVARRIDKISKLKSFHANAQAFVRAVHIAKNDRIKSEPFSYIDIKWAFVPIDEYFSVEQIHTLCILRQHLMHAQRVIDHLRYQIRKNNQGKVIYIGDYQKDIKACFISASLEAQNLLAQNGYGEIKFDHIEPSQSV